MNSLGISYQVVYEDDDGEENIVLKQSIRSGKVIDNTESVTLTVSKSDGKDKKSSNSDTSNIDVTIDDSTPTNILDSDIEDH